MLRLIPSTNEGPPTYTDRMKLRIDSPTGKRMIAARFVTVEPVFGNLRHNKRLNRFTLRGQSSAKESETFAVLRLENYPL